MWGAVFIALLGVIFIVMGYLVKFKEMVGFIPGYDPESYTDVKGLTNVIGIAYILIGIVTIVMAPYMVTGSLYYLRLWLLFFGGILIGAVILISRYGAEKK
ncbi:MAG: hypothetical protein PWR13_970 [Archaeoglobi archaeon]|nr:DUF3784 domain-containing protein [Candidatus Mnemosynella bozhongmuii]MDK2781942.1 hypothetical protein [Archaeoglobi archaeon]